MVNSTLCKRLCDLNHLTITGSRHLKARSIPSSLTLPRNLNHKTSYLCHQLPNETAADGGNDDPPVPLPLSLASKRQIVPSSQQNSRMEPSDDSAVCRTCSHRPQPSAVCIMHAASQNLPMCILTRLSPGALIICMVTVTRASWQIAAAPWRCCRTAA